MNNSASPRKNGDCLSALINFSFQRQFGELIQLKQVWMAIKASQFEAAAAAMLTWLRVGNWKSARILRVTGHVAIGE